MEPANVILFDGVCNLCIGSVQFVIERDKKNCFKFASLQSNFGQQHLSKLSVSEQNIDSIVLLQNGICHTKSSAALRIAKELCGGWKLWYVFILVPKFLRDFVYDFVARNRYKWFGKSDVCMVPTPELKAKFIG